MAVVNHVNDAATMGNGVDPDRARVIRWTPLLNGDTGDYLVLPQHRDYSVQVFGTFGVGGSVSLQGTNEAGTPANPIILTDTRGGANPLIFTAAGLLQGLQAPVKLRPIVTAGDGATALTVIVKAARD